MAGIAHYCVDGAKPLLRQKAVRILPNRSGPQALGEGGATRDEGPHPHSCNDAMRISHCPTHRCGSQLSGSWAPPGSSRLPNALGTRSGIQDTGAVQTSVQGSARQQETATRSFTFPPSCVSDTLWKQVINSQEERALLGGTDLRAASL